MNTFAATQKGSAFRAYEMACPYNGTHICTASFSSIAIDNRKREVYCCTENYDNCPLFLSKILRKV